MCMFNECAACLRLAHHSLRDWQRDEALGFRDWGRMGTNSEDPSERFGHSVDGIDYDFKFLYGALPGPGRILTALRQDWVQLQGQ